MLKHMQHFQLWILAISFIAGTTWAQGPVRVKNECTMQPLPQEVMVDKNGLPTALMFGTAVDFEGRSYPIERVHLELVREDLLGKRDTAIFHYDGMWQMRYNDTTAARWAHILAPKNVWNEDPAIGNSDSGCFWGRLDLDANCKSVSVHGVIRRIGQGPIIGEWRQSTKVVPDKFQIPRDTTHNQNFSLRTDSEKRQFLIQGHLKKETHVCIYMINELGQLVVVLDEGNYKGKYAKIVNFGNTLSGVYAVMVRIGEKEQFMVIGKP